MEPVSKRLEHDGALTAKALRGSVGRALLKRQK
jgi:hypothetical protein